MWAFPASSVVFACLLLAGCTPIRSVERFELVGYWQTEGYVCRGVPAPLPVRLEHDGSTLRAYRRVDDACGMYGELSWMGEFPSRQVRTSSLPIELSVVMNVQPAEERVRVPGVATVTSPNALTVRGSDGTRYSLVRELEPTRSEDLPSQTRPSDPSTEQVTTTKRASDSGGASGGPHSVGGSTAADNVAGAGADRPGSEGNANSGMGRKPVDKGGVGGTLAADGGSGDSGAATSGAADGGSAGGTGGAASAERDAGMTTAPERDAGVPMQPAPDAGAPTPNGPRPTDRWYCIDSTDRQGQSYCNCTVDSRRHTDSCTLPKPTCCFTFNDILEQCLCYQPGSSACESFSADGGVLPGKRVDHCPP
ncbi:MAG TPA: hypothetical protein VMF89_00280 [Polyangiales bacterium]|nr:hypothetical protein [Polyangiales bacterium]